MSMYLSPFLQYVKLLLQSMPKQLGTNALYKCFLFFFIFLFFELTHVTNGGLFGSFTTGLNGVIVIKTLL